MAEQGASHDADPLAVKFDEAVLLQKEGQLSLALAGFEAVYEESLKQQGPDHPDTLKAHHFIAMVYNEQGDYARAEMVNREVLARREQVFGRGARQTWGSLFNLLATLNNQIEQLPLLNAADPASNATASTAPYKPTAIVKAAEAEVIARQLLKSLEEGMGKDAPPALGTRRQLILLLKKLGHSAEAQQYLGEGLALVESMTGPARDGEIQAMREVQQELQK